MEGEYLRTYRQMRQRIEVYAHAETPESGGESVLRDGERCDELGGIETRTVLTRVGRMDMVGKMEGELWKKHWEKHPPPPPPPPGGGRGGGGGGGGGRETQVSRI